MSLDLVGRRLYKIQKKDLAFKKKLKFTSKIAIVGLNIQKKFINKNYDIYLLSQVDFDPTNGGKVIQIKSSV